MKLYGLLVAQNEGDIIGDTLEFLRQLKIYEDIFFYDLGSEDDTYEKALQFKDILGDPQILDEVYTGKLRFDLLAKHRDRYREGDWVAIIDADEFYVDNPKDFIAIAESEGANCVKTYQADFMFTDLDLRNLEKEDRNLPIYKRRNHYLIDWSEERFYKFLPGPEFLRSSKVCSKKLLNRHYQYRSPQQIETRIKTRIQNKIRSAKRTGRSPWVQIFSENWRDYVVSHQILHRYHVEKGFQFGIPQSVEWKDYFSVNPNCYIIPQMAEAILKDRSGTTLDVEGSAADTFQNPFTTNVKRQIHEDFLASKWKNAALGIWVLIRFHFRMLLKQMSLKYFCTVFKMKNLAITLLSNFRRFLSGKSAGFMVARPNPILLSDISEAGSTTLHWKCLRTNAVEVRVDAPDGPLLSHSGSSGTAATGKWVLDRMVFFLQDVSNELPLAPENTIAKVRIVLKATVFQQPIIGGSLQQTPDER